MHITLLDLNDRFVTQQTIATAELPGAVVLGDRVFFRWQEATYRETMVVRLAA